MQPSDPAEIPYKVADHERRLQRVEQSTSPIPVLTRDVEKGFEDVQKQFNNVDKRLNSLNRGLWVFATAFITASVGIWFLALQLVR